MPEMTFMVRWVWRMAGLCSTGRLVRVTARRESYRPRTQRRWRHEYLWKQRSARRLATDRLVTGQGRLAVLGQHAIDAVED